MSMHIVQGSLGETFGGDGAHQDDLEKLKDFVGKGPALLALTEVSKENAEKIASLFGETEYEYITERPEEDSGYLIMGIGGAKVELLETLSYSNGPEQEPKRYEKNGYTKNSERHTANSIGRKGIIYRTTHEEESYIGAFTLQNPYAGEHKIKKYIENGADVRQEQRKELLEKLKVVISENEDEDEDKEKTVIVHGIMNPINSILSMMKNRIGIKDMTEEKLVEELMEEYDLYPLVSKENRPTTFRALKNFIINNEHSFFINDQEKTEKATVETLKLRNGDRPLQKVEVK